MNLQYYHYVNDTPGLYIDEVPQLLVFLSKFKLLLPDFEILVKYQESNKKHRIIRIPKSLHKFIYYLILCDSVELTASCKNCRDIKMLKSRSVNYYCKHHLQNMISVFGNEKAWGEFCIERKYKYKKFEILKFDYCNLHTFNKHSSLFYIRSFRYFDSRVFLVESGIKSPLPSHYNARNLVFPSAVKISKRKISNTMSKTIPRSIVRIHKFFVKYQSFLTQDGIDALKDLNLLQILS